MKRVNYDKLVDYVKRSFVEKGIEDNDAEIISKVLVEADLRGIPSHGVARLRRYIDGISNKMMIPNAKPTIVYEDGTITKIDANDGMGQPVSYFAMNKAIEKAKTNNIGISVVNNSNHFGIAGYYSMMALSHNLIGITMTNSAPLVVPTFGSEAMFGTNPLSVAVPSNKEYPFVLDMATSVIPRGKIEVYKRKNENLKPNWVVNENGDDALEPAEILSKLATRGGGGILPLGGKGEEYSGHKGYGLAIMVEIFAGVLSGANFLLNTYPKTSDGKPLPSKIGHFFAAIKIDNFRNISEFKTDMDDLILQLKNSKKAKNADRIYIHGEKEYINKESNLKLGVPLEDNVFDMLKQVSEELNIKFV